MNKLMIPVVALAVTLALPGFAAANKKAAKSAEAEKTAEVKPTTPKLPYYRTLKTAKAAAAEYKQPICIAFLQKDSDASKEFERNVYRTKEFKDFATSNLVVMTVFTKGGANGKAAEKKHGKKAAAGAAAAGAAAADAQQTPEELFNVKSYPTVVFANATGSELFSVKGYQKETTAAQWIETAVADLNKNGYSIASAASAAAAAEEKKSSAATEKKSARKSSKKSAKNAAK